MDEILGFVMGITNTLLENVISNMVAEAKDKKEKWKFEKDLMDSIEFEIKEAFEEDKIKDFLMGETYNLDKNVLLYSDTDRERFLYNFFKKNPELKYVHTKQLENVINEYIDRINDIVNKVLTSEGKIVVNTIKKETDKQSEKILQCLEKSTNDILTEIKNSANVETQEEQVETKFCLGYGDKSGICTNYIDKDSREYCIDCLRAEYYDRIINLYKIQRYTILKEENYFIVNQNIGIVKVRGIVIPFYSNLIGVLDEDIYKIIEGISGITDTQKYNFIHIVSNGKFDIRHKKLLEQYNATVYTEENIINHIMDFSFYLHSVIEEYKDSELYNHYIEIYDENTNEPLLNSINDFISDNYGNALLILGDYGCGKTSFLLNLAYTLASSYLEGKNQYIPLFIPLKDYSKAISFENMFMNFFSSKCNISNPSIEAFRLLLRYQKFIILFDGFDEVAKRVNYDVKFEIFNEICKYGLNDTKLLVTCRPNYFQEKREYKKLIENAHLHFEPNSNSLDFEETYIKELNEAQISNYIDSFSKELSDFGLNPEEVERFIKETHDLMDLSKRPFLLSIIVKTLPQLIKELKIKRNFEQHEINAARLYENYVSLWLDRENLKGKTLIRKEDKLYFCRHIAYRMFVDDEHYLHFSKFPEEIRKYFTNLSNIDEIDYFSHDIQSCSFMNADGLGNFKFIHKSFMEYFVATVICDKLQKKEEIDAEYLGQVLSVRGISTEIALFINDVLNNNPVVQKRVFSALEKNVDLVDDKVRENIITILTKTKSNISDLIESNKNYTGNDFSHAVIKNKTIKNANFSNASFYNAQIENVKFVNCVFEQTYFQKAVLMNIDFSYQSLEYSDLSYSEIKNCKFVNSYLAECQLAQASVINNDFEGCDMSGINVEGTMFDKNYYEDVLGLPYEMM